jgi:hypothetical protein
MTSIAHQTRTTAATAPVERAVFVTDDDRRSRIARRLALIVLAVAGLWLSALAVGMLGLGRLPGLSLPLPGVGDKAGQQIEQPSPRPLLEQASVDAVTPASAKRQAVVRAAATTAAVQRSRAKALSAARRTPTVPARWQRGTPAASTSPPAQPATTNRVARGLERRGLTEPRGQTQKAAATATATPPGQTKEPKGQMKRADTTTPPPAPPPAPPGQQKPDKPPPAKA